MLFQTPTNQFITVSVYAPNKIEVSHTDDKPNMHFITLEDALNYANNIAKGKLV